jgi:hypothetical protein
MWSRAAASPTLRRIAALVLAVLLYQGWLTFQAVGKAEPGLGDSPDEQLEGHEDALQQPRHGVDDQLHARPSPTCGSEALSAERAYAITR